MILLIVDFYDSNDVYELIILKEILNNIFIKELKTNPFKIVLLINSDIELKLINNNIYINFKSLGASVKYNSYNIFKDEIIKNINKHL